MQRANTVIGSITILLAAGMLYLSVNLPTPFFLGRTGLGPAYFPIAVAISMGALGVLLILREALWPRGGGGSREGSDSPFRLDALSRNRVISVFGLFIAYNLSLYWIGYVIGTFLFLVVVIAYLGRYKWRLTLPVGAGLTLLLWGIFVGWLRVPVPPGPWGF